jgi:hypothetical protein
MSIRSQGPLPGQCTVPQSSVGDAVRLLTAFLDGYGERCPLTQTVTPRKEARW